jgi:hypothetical protein
LFFTDFFVNIEDEEQTHLPVALVVPTNNLFKLLAFWPANIDTWFASVDGIFELQVVTSQRACYFKLLASLPKAIVVLIADLIESSPLTADPFDPLKARLVTANQLTAIQRVEKLLKLQAMGLQKLSAYSPEMLRICPRGEESYVPFN